MELDHIAIAGLRLAEATDHVAQTLGVTPQPGGEHAVFQTHNTLLGLADGLYLEAIAIQPGAGKSARPRWFDLDRFAGPARLTNWICRCQDLEATLAELPDSFGQPVRLARGDLRWRMAVPATGILPFDNCAPALMQWEGEAHPAALLPGSGCRMTGLTVSHPQAAQLQALLAPHLADPRVTFRTAAAGLAAAFDTPSGQAVLT